MDHNVELISQHICVLTLYKLRFEPVILARCGSCANKKEVISKEL